MKVELKEMHLRNFKGVLDQTFQFSHDTIVRGTNGTGKTTLNDAFMFCLFGKDSKGNTNFGYKRMDNSGNVVHNLEYSVEVTLLVDGIEKRFERTMTEKWTKPRGGSEKVLSGHEGTYYIDRVNTTQKDFNAAVSAIASDEVLRMMTDVNFFMSLKDDVKKNMLLKMAYGTDNADEADTKVTQEVLADEPQFSEFVKRILGITLQEFNLELAANAKRIKAEIEEIPIKIASKKETVPPADDWDGLQSLIDEHREILADIERQIADDNARQVGMTDEVNRLKIKLSEKQFSLQQAENTVKMAISNQESDVKTLLYKLKNELTTIKEENTRDTGKLNASIEKRNTLELQLQQMREKFKAIKNGEVTFSEDELQCPTCHRPYDKDVLIEQKLQENKAQGQKLRAEYENACDEATLLEKKVNENCQRITVLQSQIDSIDYHPADVNSMIASDSTCQQIRQEIEQLKANIDDAPKAKSDEALLQRKYEINTKLQEFSTKLAARDVITRVESQVLQLEERQRTLNSELATIERDQDTAKEFQKAKDRHLLDKVNSLFQIVTWKFVSEQLNGNDRISCNCYVEGMPYNERNHAGQVNAGLDIINAIAKSEGITLPIFVDNAESVVEYLPTESQKIRLMVDANFNELKFELK